MLCESCKQNEATVHTMTIINGVKEEHYLCPECANAAQFKLPSLMDMLGGSTFAMPQMPASKVCECGKSLGAFNKSGLLGCADCYTTYPNAIRSIIKRVQGGKTRHVGRMPENFIPAADTQTAPVIEEKVPQISEVDRLRSELQEAVAQEKYERAAELRDRIRALESEAQEHE